jgi:GNAT superfamily N-acetyltransferase
VVAEDGGVLDVAAADIGGFFLPERPGPLIQPHIAATGVGRCRADRWPDPRTVIAELPGDNVAVRGVPMVVEDLAGLVEAPPEWLPALRESDPATALWPRLISALPPTAELPPPRAGVRRLGPGDAPALEHLDPSIAWGAFDGDVLASVACVFFVGRQHEDVGVVTEAASRGRGLSTACAAAVAAEIRARGRTPTWATSPDNAGSRAVAAHLGFAHVRDDVLYAVRIPIPVPD